MEDVPLTVMVQPNKLVVRLGMKEIVNLVWRVQLGKFVVWVCNVSGLCG